MRCDVCGCTIDGEPFFDTINEEDGSTGAYIHNTTAVPITLCAQCANRRRQLPRYMLFVFVLALGAVTLISVWLKW